MRGGGDIHLGRTECPVVSSVRRTISRMGWTMSVTDRYFKPAWNLPRHVAKMFPHCAKSDNDIFSDFVAAIGRTKSNHKILSRNSVTATKCSLKLSCSHDEICRRNLS